MAETPEGKVKRACKELYKAAGAYYIQTVLGMGGSNGTPDQQVCRPGDGHFGNVETKAGKWQVSALQRVRLQETAAAGGSSMVINESNLHMLETWLRQTGWKVNAVFDDKDKVTHHVAVAIAGGAPFEIKNPDLPKRAKSGKPRTQRA